MGNILLRAEIQEIGVIFNGDQNDGDLRDKLDRREGAVIKAKRKLAEAKQGGKEKAIRNAQDRLKKAEEKLKEAKPEKDNVLTAVLAYPRSGESSIMAMRPLDLPSGGVLDLRKEGFFESALLKEEIQGETTLQVVVTDKDKKNSFWLFVRSVLGAVFGEVTKGVIGDISEVFVSKTASGLSKKIEDIIKGDGKGKVSAVAQSQKARIEIGDDGKVRVVNSGASADAPIFYDGESGELSLKMTAPKQLVTQDPKFVEPNNKKPKDTIEKGAPNGHVVLKFSGEVLA